MTEVKTIPFQSTWDIRHSVMWPNKKVDYVKLPDDEQGQHFGLFVGEELVSIVSTFITSNEAQFRKFATLNEFQGKGHGTTLLTYLMTELELQNLKRIWCNARVDKTNFYKRFGLTTTQNTFSKGGVDYVVMEKIV
ncbi:MAG: GNAT family N-acetyltransferase [Reichenbachiella sp.]|uniref:GNAT family N-acetyltransferase n=1 Tax=Reichenbachiella sp. TaxID=2184521 RepID=UPI0032648C10